MQKIKLIALLVMCLVGSTFAQISPSSSQTPNALIQGQPNINPTVIYENGQVKQNPNSSSNNNNMTNPNGANQNSNHSNHQKNGNHVLGHYWDTTMCGLNYTQGSTLVETRYNQYAVSTIGSGNPAHVTISALPPNAIVVKALVYWEVSYQAGSSTTPTLITTNPSGPVDTITATMIGQDGPKCWGDIGTRAFRVNLPVGSTTNGGAIGCNGIYTFNIGGNSAWEIDGITLMIIYQDPSVTYNGSIYLDDGCISSYAQVITDDVTGLTVCQVPSYGDAFSIVTDMQDNINSAVHNAKFNNVQYTNAFPNSFYNFDEHTSNYTSGQTICTNGYDGGSCSCDCYAWIMTGCYFQTACTTCTPTNGSNMTLTMDSTNTTCNQANGTATVNATGGNSPYTYHWSNGQSTQTATGLGAGVYYVTVVDASGCHSQIDSVTIFSSASVIVNLTVTNVTCFGLSTGQIIADTSGGIAPFIYQWSPTGGNTLTAANIPAGIYTFLITDAIGCTKAVSDTVTEPPLLIATSAPTGELCFNTATGTVPLDVSGGTPGYSYSWSPAQGNVATAINLFAGIYNVTITDANGCTVTNNAVVTEPAQLTLSLSPNTTICIGQTANLATFVGGGTPTYSYAWDNGSIAATQTVNPVVTTTYNVTVADINGCTATTAPITIFVNPPLAVVAQASAQICQGQSATISAVATGGNGNYTYTWDNGIGVATGIITVTPSITTIYTVVVTDNCTIPNVSTYDTVVVNSAPQISFSGFPLRGCAPLSVKFTNATTSSLPIIKWDWDFGDATAHNDSIEPTHIYYNPGIFNVTLTAISSSNCISTLTDSAYIDVYPVPVARFLIDPLVTTIISPEITFTDQSQGADTLYYDFGDGNTTTLRNPFHTYQDTGMYWITQYVMNNYGCVDSIIGTVTIMTDYEFYIPSAFSPNGDGMNNYFMGVGRNVKEYAMTIFDRWGELLFHSDDMGIGWDGTFNGVNCKQDTYIYDFKFRDNTNIAHQFTGHVTLLR